MSARVDDGTLLIDGDRKGNAIVIERGSADPDDRTTLRVRGLNGTTVNGSSSPATFAGVDRGGRVDLGSGRDRLDILNVRLQSAWSVSLGNASDALSVRGSRVTGAFAVDAGAGEDQQWFRNSVFQTDFTGTGGGGDDRFRFSRADVAGAMRWADRFGQTFGSINRLAVAGEAAIRTGGSVDHLTIESSAFGGASVQTAGRDDRVTIRATNSLGESAIDAGAGEDRVEQELTFAWDFDADQQGWRSGLSDYSSIVEDPQTGEGIRDAKLSLPRYEYSAGIEPLPAQLGNGNGFKTTSRNLADDHFMYFTRRLNAGEGISSDREYDVWYDVRFATNTPAGLLGAGGPPAEAVVLKVGAINREPRVSIGAITPGGSDVELNVRKENSDTDQELFPIGDIRNGEPASTTSPWRVVRRVTTSRSSVTSDDAGNVWLVAGTDSGFEGTTVLFYTRIIVRLTSVRS